MRSPRLMRCVLPLFTLVTACRTLWGFEDLSDADQQVADDGGESSIGDGGHDGGSDRSVDVAATDIDPPTQPSCAGGLSCGNGDCCASGAVSGGTFLMGRASSGPQNDVCTTLGCHANELPEHPATVSTFALDVFEVTVSRFRKFVASYPANRPKPGAGAHPRIAASGWDPTWDGSLPTDQPALLSALKCNGTFQTWTDLPGTKENKPIVCVSWYVAFAFCAWDGGRLPTEVEWEYAAGGGAEKRALPWGGATLDRNHASYYCQETDGGCGADDILSVGSTPLGRGKFGQHDLVGGAWEWTLDAYVDPYPATACTDCATLAGTSRVTRGGAFGAGADWIRTNARYGNTAPELADHNVGLRCARTAK